MKTAKIYQLIQELSKFRQEITSLQSSKLKLDTVNSIAIETIECRVSELESIISIIETQTVDIPDKIDRLEEWNKFLGQE